MLDSIFLTVPVAAVLGFLAGLGVGGGSLLILWLTMVLGMDTTEARGINLLFFLPAAAISCLFRWKQGKLNLKTTLPAAISGCIAAMEFTRLSGRIETGLLKKGFGILLLFTGFRELFYKQRRKPHDIALSGQAKGRKGGDHMIQDDTIKLLRECDAGVKMGIASIDDVLPHVTSDSFQKDLASCKQEHEKLGDEIRQLLDKYHDDGKQPNPMAKTMSKMKTSMKLSMEETDATIADLMTDGCNMGVKSLSRYLNQYKAADEVSKDIAKRLIKQEDQLIMQARPYL